MNRMNRMNSTFVLSTNYRNVFSFLTFDLFDKNYSESI